MATLIIQKGIDEKPYATVESSSKEVKLRFNELDFAIPGDTLALSIFDVILLNKVEVKHDYKVKKKVFTLKVEGSKKNLIKLLEETAKYIAFMNDE